MDDHYVVLGRENCPWCEKAVELLDMLGFSFTYFDVRDNEQIRSFLIANGLKTVPQVYLDGELIGGYEDLLHWMGDN